MKCRLCTHPAEPGQATCAICRVLYDRWARGKAEQREVSRRHRQIRQRERTAPVWSGLLGR